MIDTSRNSDNEYFGRFLTGQTAAVPPSPSLLEPGSALLAIAALPPLAALGACRRWRVD